MAWNQAVRHDFVLDRRASWNWTVSHLGSFCPHIPEGKRISETRKRLSVRRLHIRRLRTMEDIRHERCMRASTIVNTCQTRAKGEDVMTFLDLQYINITIEKRRTTKRRLKEALRERSLSEWCSLMESVQFIQNDVLKSAWSISRF